MAIGYALGTWMVLPRDVRRRRLAWLGGAMTLGFFVVRGLNVYGDPRPWAVQHDTTATILSFLNCTKYPPSLSFLLMTLGPAMVFLAWCDGVKTRIARPFIVFGRVPLFFYVLHLPFIHALAVATRLAMHVTPVCQPDSPECQGLHAPLPVVYAVWVAVMVALYFPCRWFAGVKRRRNDPWLSYC
jgi:uncharacterized membrane protein